ncbi:sugar ABC transporter ATP-binding protein [Oceanispirochaeta crateris]|nr:sugar ABC transporter ATP-binding protein [Oceanispirochaeta crateris]
MIISRWMNVLLKLSDICRSFNSVPVLRNINVDFHSGEIHSIVGENGAGKTTLVHIISGLLKPDNGEIQVNGRTWSSLGYQTALKMGIVIVRQNLILPGKSTLAEYIFLGREPSLWGVIDYKTIYKKSDEILRRLQLSFSSSTRVEELNLAEKRMLAVARAVYLHPKILILDEATNLFSTTESERFNRLMGILRNEGMCIIHISHKLDEVLRISDRITVLREGALIVSSLTEKLTRDDVISHMVGKEFTQTYYWKPHFSGGDEILTVQGLGKNRRLKNISLSLREGEVLGLAGLVGSGRTTLGRILFGLDKPDEGTILLRGKSVSIDSPRQALNLGIGYTSEDRHSFGVMEDQSMGFNLTVNILKRISQFFYILKRKERAAISNAMECFLLGKYSPDQLVKTLSGGTQQKVAFARCTSNHPDILIVDEPAREVDIEGSKEIFSILNNLAGQKTAVILISSVLGDLINNCDRILIMKSGQIVKELRKTEFNEEMILHYAIDSRISKKEDTSI